MKKLNKIAILIILTVIFTTSQLFSEELTFVTVNAWSGLDYSGFFNCNEYEEDNVRGFRGEILTTGLKDLDADVIVLNGINPAGRISVDTAASLGMIASSSISRSGFRIGPVGLPINLREGDAVLTAKNWTAVPAGRLHMNGAFSKSVFTLFSREGVQVLGFRLVPAVEEAPINEVSDVEDTLLYVFSAVWTESLFNDERSMRRLTDAYLSGEITADEYPVLVENAVAGAKARLQQAEQTLSFINSVAGSAPVVLLGSLNTLPDSQELKVLKSAGFIDVYEEAGRGAGYTIDTVSNSNFEKIREAAEDGNDAAAALNILSGGYRADYIMTRGEGLKAISAEIVLDEPVYGVYPSNRFGVKAVIQLNN